MHLNLPAPDFRVKRRLWLRNLGVMACIAQAMPAAASPQQGRLAMPAKSQKQFVSATPTVVSFRNHVLPILTKNGCNSGACHGAAAGKGGLKLSLRGFDPDADHAVLTRQAWGRRVVAGDPGHSLLLLKPSMQIGHGGGERIRRNSPDYKIIAVWIAGGALPPRPDDVKLLGLDVSPFSAILHPGDKRQITVQARYANGNTEDVTRWVKFGTSDSNVANVDDNGRVTAQGRGEAAVTVWFSSKVTFARVVSPFPNAPAPDVYAHSIRNNFVDNLVLDKLQILGLPPSGSCSDGEFIRRAYLDAAGILPTPKETHAFLADTRPDKRARLIDGLLERPEFVDYWTYKWCDLLLVSSRKLNPPSLKAFQGWIRQSVQANKPWDQFARELLTARGSNLENGAANYYVLHKEPIDLTETTTQAFMGMSLTCARCHNHPMEKWTQRDYFQMANLFARVRLKNGDQAGEAIVIPAKDGNINLPRLNIPLAPRPLDGQAITLTDARDRRELLADWLTSSDNPYFARAVVNRVWRNFMGRGLVEAEDDLRLTNPPSNPALLDALARDFARPAFARLAAKSDAAGIHPVQSRADADERNFFHDRYTAPIAADRVAARTAGVSALARNLEPALFPARNRRGGSPDGGRAVPAVYDVRDNHSALGNTPRSDVLDAGRGDLLYVRRDSRPGIGRGVGAGAGAGMDAPFAAGRNRLRSGQRAGNGAADSADGGHAAIRPGMAHKPAANAVSVRCAADMGRGSAGKGHSPADQSQTLTPPNPAVAPSTPYDIKRLIRTIMNSAAYQRSAVPVGQAGKDERYYAHYVVKRLPAEVILDALSQVTGVQTDFANYPKGTRALQLPDSQVASYFLTAFGRPERERTCACERQQEPNVAQALHLSNGDTINQKLRASGGLVEQWARENVPDAQVLEQLYLAALCRVPTAAERARLLTALAQSHPDPKSSLAQQQAARRMVLEDLFWAVLTDKEFLFNH